MTAKPSVIGLRDRRSRREIIALVFLVSLVVQIFLLGGVMKPTAGDIVVGGAFEDQDWAELDLAGTRFENCRFLRCGFARSDLREATFKNCGFADAEGQRGANFAFARLDEATFDNCNLAHARFEGADLSAVRFNDCRLLGARFARARFHRAFGRKVVRTLVSFVDCNLELADLRGADLSGFDLRRLADWTDLKINADQQFALLDALGVDVAPGKV
jgi:fluoroquinolone resistance protein